jgi:hypothetical protein
MLVSEEVEVISVNRAADVITGKLVFQVAFGSIGTPVQGLGLPSGSNQIASTHLVLFFSDENRCPYLAGSKWILEIQDDGKISVLPKQ